MKITCDITDTKTGITRRYEDNDASPDPDVLEFVWREGNFGCDCNRALFFARAGGESDDCAWDLSYEAGCSGRENRFRVERLTLEDGRTVEVDARGGR